MVKLMGLQLTETHKQHILTAAMKTNHCSAQLKPAEVCGEYCGKCLESHAERLAKSRLSFNYSGLGGG